MADISTEEIIKVVKEKLAQKTNVIREQQAQIQDLENQILELQQQLTDCRKSAQEHDMLVKGLAEILD
jgi:hypothetical protein